MRCVALLVAVSCLLAIAGCGKKGPPTPPGPPSEITWPRVYPTH
ncbi:MAG TPA: lipoprotein [Acetobacteraceae bacterium]|jgi:predicted small lipoprotein YifL|nr:lipoprotein [Acetobacteraceae bacterium]